MVQKIYEESVPRFDTLSCYLPFTMYHVPFTIQNIYLLVIYHVPFIWLFEHLSLCIEEMSVAFDVEDAVNHPFTI